MKITDYVKRDHIYLSGEMADKEEALRYLCGRIAADTGSDFESIFKSVMERERKLSTGIGLGIAVPHGRIKSWGDTVMTLLLLDEPVDYGSLDGSPVRLIILFVSDSDKPCEHVNILSKISYVLAQGDTLDRILSSSSSDQLYDTIVARENDL